jgi:hypothetical protein
MSKLDLIAWMNMRRSIKGIKSSFVNGAVFTQQVNQGATAARKNPKITKK